MRKINNSIIAEARRITKWNKRRLNKQVRKSWKNELSGKGCQYKRTSFDARLHTMA